MAGFGAPRRGPRLPPSVLLVLLAVLGLLAFNYWSVSGRQAELTTELGAMQAQAERTEVARLRLERRNTELLLLIDEHRAEARREREQRGGLEQRLWGSQGRQIGMQENMSRLMADIAHLKEKLTDLNQAFLQREDQLHELHTNNTYLLNRLEQESLRCGEQIKELKVQHEARVIKLPEAAVPDQTAKPVGLIESSKERKLDFDETAKNNAMKDTVENFSMMVEDASKVPIKNVEEAVNPEESDAGMPELEENGAANLEDHPAALKKPLPLAPEVILNLQSKQPKDSKLVTGSLMTLELKPDVGNPPDPLQIQPLEMHSKQNTENSRKELFPKKRNTSFLNLKQSRFFDENESPVDPQHGSKVADYNGDDGNVDDEERDAQEDPADYRKDSINDAL
ncbi:protein GOLM2 isoform X2 [Ambystoma mexicanum]|uniref:protein GOLM2 isoform X2 n=1 Tax=Ambystoma mexicanum TaxID=8296 RepID=UPI0037E8E750